MGTYLFYEEARPDEGAEREIGTLRLKRAQCDSAAVLREAETWQLVERVSYAETVLWHDKDRRAGDYTVVHTFSACLVRDGHFNGAVFTFDDSGSLGMSWTHEGKRGAVCVDGQTFGDVRRHASHCSTEIDREETGTFSLEKR